MIILGFLRDARATFISALALPTSVIATVWFLEIAVVVPVALMQGIAERDSRSAPPPDSCFYKNRCLRS